MCAHMHTHTCTTWATHLQLHVNPQGSVSHPLFAMNCSPALSADTNCPAPCFSDLGVHQNHPEGFAKTQIPGPTPRVAESAGLEEGLWFCLSDQLPGDAAAGPGTTLGEPLGESPQKVSDLPTVTLVAKSRWSAQCSLHFFIHSPQKDSFRTHTCPSTAWGLAGEWPKGLAAATL